MADNVTLPGTGAVIASDDVGSVQYQVVKLDVGGNGASTPVTSTGLPVNDAGGSLTIDGSVTANAGTNLNTSALATEATLSAASAKLPASLGPKTEGASLSTIRATPPKSYCAAYRIAVAGSDLALAFTFTANTDKHLATIYHPSSSTKTVKIRKVSISMATSVAGAYGFEIRRLDGATAPATGNPAITPASFVAGNTADSVCLALPTTQGSVANVDQNTVSKHAVVTVSASAGNANWAMGLIDTVLYEFQEGKGMEPLTMSPNVADGFAIVARCTATSTLRFVITIEFTEE